MDGWKFEMGAGKLQCFWDNYTSCERDPNEEKLWFDFFLAQFLIDFQKSKAVPGNLNSNIADIIAREFILEVHNVCKKSDENDELAPLKKYFLCGRGWRCLAVLQQLDVSKLSNAYELSHLLIPLFDLVEYQDCLNCVKTNPYLSHLEHNNIDVTVREKLNSIKRKSQNCKKKRNLKNTLQLNKLDEITPFEATRKEVSGPLKIFPADSVKYLFHRNKGEECSRAVTDAAPLHTKSKNQFTLDSLKGDPVFELLEHEVTNTEFGLLILNLLQRVCSTDCLVADEYENVIGTVIKFSLDNLCRIQYRFVKHSDPAIEKLKSQLTYLLITCADGTRRCRRIIESLSDNGIVQILLQLLQEVTSSINPAETDDAFIQRNLNFLYSLSYCILILFFQILRQDNIAKHLNAFNKLYRQFIGCASGRLFENIIKTFISSSVDRSAGVKRVKIIVTFLGLLILRFKTLRRRVCRVEENSFGREEQEGTCCVSSHHDHLLGKPFKSVILCPAALHENCCISSTFVVLLKIALENLDEELTVTVYRILLNCGTCCCVPVSWFLPKVLKTLTNQNAQVKHLILRFLERRFYRDVGMYRNEICPSCTLAGVASDQWMFLDEYKALLLNDNAEIVRLTGNHLLKIFGNLSYEIQQYLVLQVLQFIFHLTQNEYSRNGSSHRDCILVCLAVFGDLSVHRMFPVELDELLTTKAIRQLLVDPNFTELCCRMLETRIMYKTAHLDHGGGTFTPVLAESCTAELNVLLNMFDLCYEKLIKLTCEPENSAPLEDVAVDGHSLFHLRMITCTLKRLTVRSSAIKSYLHSHPVKDKFQKLLFLVLKVLSDDHMLLQMDSSHTVDDIRLKITQPLLIICLCLFDDVNTIENRVKDLLHEALQAGTISIKQVCDSLLSLEQVENVHKESLENWNNTATTAALIFSDSDENLENNVCEAYEDVISWSHVENAMSEISSDDDNQLVSLLDSYSKSTLLYPMVCTIALDLINALRVDRCSEEALYVLQHISTICQRNSDICIELTKQKIVSKLLDKLEDSLAEELLTPEETDVQYAITQFLSVLFHHRLERTELIRFLNFLKIPRAPYDHLIRTLTSVIEKSVYEVHPTFYLNFPTAAVEQTVEFDDPAEALAISMRDLQKHTTAISPWVVSCLTLPLNTNLDWCIWISGFSTSFWLKYGSAFRVDRNEADVSYEDPAVNPNEVMVHLISVGYDTMLLEAWIDERTSCLTVRLTRPEGSSFEILSQVVFQKPLDDAMWHNIVLNVKDTMRQQKIALEITLTVDGHYEETRYLIFLGIFMRKVRPACVLLGDTRTTLRSRYSVGNLMMFRAAILSKDCCLTIRAFGPDFENVLSCPANALKPNFTHLMRLENQKIALDFSVTRLTMHFDENMKRMQDNLLIIYTPRKVDTFYHYTKTDLASSGAVFPSSTPTLFRRNKYPRNSERIPHPMKAILFSVLDAEHRESFYDCVQQLGGLNFLAYLFANLVDSCRSESTQCDALKLILKACFVDVRLYSQFVVYNGYNLISKVITSPRSRIPRLAFIELTNAMCNKDNYFLRADYEVPANDVFVCNAHILTNVILPNWRFWEKCDPTLLTVLFRGLQSLLASTNSYKQMNIDHLVAVNVLEKTLDMCKEKFVFEETCSRNCSDLCSAILEFVKTVVGLPSSPAHITSVIDYLYVVHPTSRSFCTQSPDKFYFRFSSVCQSEPKQRSEASNVTENPLMEEEDDDEMQLSQEKVEDEQNFGESPSDVQEKRTLISNYLQNDRLNLMTSEEEEEEEKTTDSGIASGSIIDESVSPFYSAGQSTIYEHGSSVNRNGTEPENVYKYSQMNFNNSTELRKRLDSATEEDCDQYIITAGLLNIVHDTILVLPDSSIGNIMKKMIDYKLFIVMANHPNATVRNMVVKTILSWLIRCDDETAVRFVSQTKAFYHLANQLTLYPATEELVNSCISLMAHCHWDALDQISELEEITLPTLHISAIPPLLAIFPGTISDFNLALSVVHFLRILINKVPQALKKIMEHGLVESLVKAMLDLIHSKDATNEENNTFLLTEIIELFALIMNVCIQTPGVSYLQILNEIVYKFRYLEVTQEAQCGAERECIRIIHDLICKVLRSGLDSVLTLIDSHHSQDSSKGRRSPSFLASMTGSMSASLSSIPNSIISSTASNGKQKQLPRSEIIDRYKLIISRGTEYLQFSSSSVLTENDMEFAEHLFRNLISGVSDIVQNKPYIRIGSPWSSVYWSARETLRIQASNLLIWMLTPERPVHLRMSAINTLMNESSDVNEPKEMVMKQIITTLIFMNVETEQRFTIFLWHLMYSKNSDLEEADMDRCEEFKATLQKLDIISPQGIGQAHDRWHCEVKSAVKELPVEYWSLEKAQQDAVYKCVYRTESLSKKISDIATSLSAAVVDRQGKERKRLLNDMREKYRIHVDTRNRWREIVQQMTHERAPWYHPDMYPDCWELDPTEGPVRVRKRLRRCKLNIKGKFFKPEFAMKMKNEENYPLAYLFENDDVQTLYTAALDSLSMDDTISYMCFALNVQPGYEVGGELLIGAKYLYFIATRIYDKNVTITEADKFSLIVKFKEIKEIHNRRFQLKERAIELFLLNGKTALIAFNSVTDRDKFISALGDRSSSSRVVNDGLLNDTVDRWREGQASNWEYLITLNKMAGRSYNDLMQYPVMPFILSDYKNDCIDLRNTDIYRNLRRPMAIQDKKKEIYFINHFNYLKNECLQTAANGVSYKQQPYHYASHYSNSGTVLHFLLRLPPYTQVFLEYQDNNFDLPDRTFHSLDTTWRLTSSESTTDVKELVPEFFYLPEFLLNLQGFNFGVRQNGEIVDNVKLPPWANGDPRLFVLVHRQILESEYVKENLPHWIDLVFGYKQTGKAATQAINVFHPATYCGFDYDSILDPLERAAWETMVKTYGQTPRQLFRTPHPMVVQNLIAEDDDNIPVVKGVKGLKWGNYVGSPSRSSPSVVWNSYHSNPVSLLVPLITNDVFGIPASTSLLLSYNKERSTNVVSEGVTLMGAALLSWRHTDGIIRVKERKEQPQLPLIFCPPKDAITICSTTPDCPLIWIGLSSGNILVFRYAFNSENGGVDVEYEPVILVGHQKKVNNICLSQSFGIAVSTSDDEYAIIWDLNEMIYIRSISSMSLPISLVAVSETLGDIATVCDVDQTESSVLWLHSINATVIGSVSVKERITAICFSNAPEGVSVNVVATGFRDGVIRLWSTWDLSPVIDIINTSINSPIIGLTYSYDSQHLYASTSEGNVYIWEAATSNGTNKTPKFLNLTAVN